MLVSLPSTTFADFQPDLTVFQQDSEPRYQIISSDESSEDEEAKTTKLNRISSTVKRFGAFFKDSFASVAGWVKTRIAEKKCSLFGNTTRNHEPEVLLGKRTENFDDQDSTAIQDCSNFEKPPSMPSRNFKQGKRHRFKGRTPSSPQNLCYFEESRLKELSEIPEVTSLSESLVTLFRSPQPNSMIQSESEPSNAINLKIASTLSQSPVQLTGTENQTPNTDQDFSSDHIMQTNLSPPDSAHKPAQTSKIDSKPSEVIDISESEPESSHDSNSEESQDDDSRILSNIQQMAENERMHQMEDHFQLEFREDPFYIDAELELLRFVTSKVHLDESVLDIEHYLQLKCLIRKLDTNLPKLELKSLLFPPTSIISRYPLQDFYDVVRNPLEKRLELANSGKATKGCFKSVINYRNARMTLKGQWLNDEIINGYTDLINLRHRGGCLYPPELLESSKRPPNAQNPDDHCLNTFFFLELKKPKPDMNKVHRMLLKREVDIKTVRRLFIPLHQGGNHWTFCVLNLVQREVVYYDSLDSCGMPKKDAKAAAMFMQWALAKRNNLETVEPGLFSEERIKLAEDNPKQHNGSDCGVFMLKGIDYLVRFNKLDFSQEDMPYFRMLILFELLYPESPVVPPFTKSFGRGAA